MASKVDIPFSGWLARAGCFKSRCDDSRQLVLVQRKSDAVKCTAAHHLKVEVHVQSVPGDQYRRRVWDLIQPRDEFERALVIRCEFGHDQVNRTRLDPLTQLREGIGPQNFAPKTMERDP